MNYIKMKNEEILGDTVQYTYLDNKNNLADDIFIQHKIPVNFLKDFVNSELGYTAVIVSFDKEYEPEFIKCMEELRTKIVSSGDDKYDDYSSGLFKITAN